MNDGMTQTAIDREALADALVTRVLSGDTLLEAALPGSGAWMTGAWPTLDLADELTGRLLRSIDGRPGAGGIGDERTWAAIELLFLREGADAPDHLRDRMTDLALRIVETGQPANLSETGRYPAWSWLSMAGRAWTWLEACERDDALNESQLRQWERLKATGPIMLDLSKVR